MFKRITRFLLVIVISLGLIGCANNATPTKAFDDFIKDLPKEMVASDSLDLNYEFNDPSKYGIKKEVASLPSSSKKESDTAYQDSERILKELESYDYDSLDDNQKLEYDILKDYLKRVLLTKDYFYLDNNFLGSFIGFQAELPFLLNEFTLNDKTDLESYLNILKTAKDTFKEYVENEKTRQKNDAGMSQVILDKVIEQCDNFVNSDVTYLVNELNEKIDKATFLTEEEKAKAKQDNENYTRNDLVQAYQALSEGLSSIKAKDADGGIAQQKNGKEYYEALFQKNCGIDMTIDELDTYLEEKMNYFSSEYLKLSKKYENEDLWEKASTATYGEFTTAEENIDYLASRYALYYPDAGTMTYRVLSVPLEMQDNFSPAAYLTSKVDRRDDEPLAIIINGDYKPSIFTTIAHEGYPGHMYQDNYFKKLNVSTFRYLVDCKGYAEGWATYAEDRSYLLTESDNTDYLKAYSYNNKIISAFMARMDILVNYKGLTREEFREKIQSVLSISDEQCDEQYDIFIETPTNSLNYYVNGFYFEDLYNKAQKALGDKFDEIAFHKVVLDTGSTSMIIVEQQVDKYIKENK